MTTKTKAPRAAIKWHGGKSYLADWIISLMPPHLHYVEPYFGGGAVLLARDTTRDWLIDEQWKLKNGDKIPAHLKGCSEVVNDINYELANFWSVLQSQLAFDEFKRRVDAIPFSQAEFEATHKEPELLFDKRGGMMALAVNFFVRYRQSRQGLGKDFATLSRNRTRGRRNEQANAWLGAVEGLPEIHERLKGVVILNDDAVKVIKQQDGENTLFYCDPPYLHETRSSTGEYGVNEMSCSDHKRLLETLSSIQGKFMLSGYHSKLYDQWAVCASNDFRCHEREIDNKASSSKTKEKRTECVWTNY